MESYQFESDSTRSSEKCRIQKILNLLTDAYSSTNTIFFSFFKFLFWRKSKKICRGGSKFFFLLFFLAIHIYFKGVQQKFGVGEPFFLFNFFVLFLRFKFFFEGGLVTCHLTPVTCHSLRPFLTAGSSV